ncbi:hypothetical protein VKT23_012492 [Stygiomarasmius scandens]|uniref:Ricin B lectin domain-containing protein n=1 Tax=Marasmiellus scandens TaxID=2682957 RepID=A0ABR1JAR3_9AGAR
MSTILETGRYTVRNAKYLNVAFLPDGNYESDIVARSEQTNDGEKWNITLLNNSRHTINSHQYSTNFATSEYRPTKGASVRSQGRNQQWIIRETRVRGQYTISPTDGELYWGLTDGEDLTPIVLAETPNDPKNQWTFKKA